MAQVDHGPVTAAETPKNRYRDAPRNADYTIDQQWETYSEEEHDRWDRLLARQKEILPGRACPEFERAMAKLDLSDRGIPDMAKLSKKLSALTGWQVVPVTDIVPDEIFFDHLANRRFPAGAFIRPEAEFDYLQEPDVFHDIFGHVPLLADPVFADFMEAYGKGGQRAAREFGSLHHLARLYWYTVEFGLIKSGDGLRIFGAGILSSPTESVYSLESDKPKRIELDLIRVMRTNYIIDDVQQTYFVIDNFDSLLEECLKDFRPHYERLAQLDDLAASAILPEDRQLPPNPKRTVQ